MLIKVFYSEEDEGFIAMTESFKPDSISAFGVTEQEAIKEFSIAYEAYIRSEGR